MERRTLLFSALGAATLAAALPARAQAATRIVFGYTAVTDFAPVFVAQEEGYFRKRNLDVELKFIPLNSTIPSAGHPARRTRVSRQRFVRRHRSAGADRLCQQCAAGVGRKEVVAMAAALEDRNFRTQKEDKSYAEVAEENP